nr:DR2241 family protein [Haladaptatus salinisoli]
MGARAPRGENASARDSPVDELVEAATEGVDFDGLRAEFDGEFTFETPETRRAGLSESAFRSFARDHPRYVSNWHHWERAVGGRDTHRRAFLRWLENANRPVPERYDALAGTERGDGGVTRTWGQLALAVSLGDGGERRYEVRHVDDREADDAALATYHDPTAIRDLSRFTDDGEYRPLRAAPTLPTGWSFVTTSGEDLYRAVEYVYPATVANWHREREGDLDATHFEEAAARQTGIYAEVEELDRDALERAVESCCVDSQCRKRRAWDVGEGDELAVPRGDGEFPCREPCSLFVAAAREFLRAEREDESKRGDADGESRRDGATVRVGEVSDPANRYRARYRRAKRVADER